MSNETFLVVQKHITTETAHRLMDYVGACANVHGHSYKWEVVVETPELGKNGIGLDFKDLKALMVEHIFVPYDHAILLHQDDPLVEVIRAHTPDTQRVVALPFNPTAECLAMHVGKTLEQHIDDLVSVCVWETETSYAKYVRIPYIKPPV